MVLVDERGLHRHVDLAVHEPCRTDEPDHHVELACRRNVQRVDLRDARVLDVGELDVRVEGDGGEDRHLRRGIGTGDVVGRIGLRIAALLRVRERLGVALAALHLGEHEVRRAVDDPQHAMHVRDDERLAQHLDHGNRRADARLEPQLDAGIRRGREELRTTARNELLVRGHDVLAATQQLEDVRACRFDAAHHLGHNRDARVVDDLGEIRGEHPTRKWVITLLPRIAHERLHDPQPMTGCALDVVRRLGQETVDCRADGAVPEQRDRYVNRRQRSPPSRSTRAGGHRPARSGSRRASRGRRRATAGRGPSRQSTRVRTIRPGSP